MRELGVTTNANYKIAFFMDHGAMITVHTPAYGVVDVSKLSIVKELCSVSAYYKININPAHWS